MVQTKYNNKWQEWKTCFIFNWKLTHRHRPKGDNMATQSKIGSAWTRRLLCGCDQCQQGNLVSVRTHVLMRGCTWQGRIQDLKKEGAQKKNFSAYTSDFLGWTQIKARTKVEVCPYFDLSTPWASLSHLGTLICYFIKLQLQMLLVEWFISEHW